MDILQFIDALNKLQRIVLLWIISLFILFIGICAGWMINQFAQPAPMDAARIAFNKLNPFQQIIFMHDRMQIGEVRYEWRQLYCGKKGMTLRPPVTVMDSDPKREVQP